MPRSQGAFAGNSPAKVINILVGHPNLPYHRFKSLPRPIVSIIRLEREGDTAGAVREAVRLAGGLGETIAEGDTVLIKPNAKNATAQGLGVNTDARIVEAVLDLVLERGAGRVVIADGAAFPSGNWDTIAAFKASGIAELAHRKNVELCDLNTAEPAIIEI